ncbi:hypothetical protein TH63_15170 [Rufibacter radiotolerans]|uniref:Uncharacterized protein n=1 Tax=Rufibacter radiotolerans TaxID=1379910 RepID=A0A0H4VSA9_9BACT|nr:hypothetical protein TH63_15170 [Rufibacter radiotolerans]
MPGGTAWKPRLSERQRVRGFLIVLVTFLIKEKSDRRRQGEGKKRVERKELDRNGLAYWQREQQSGSLAPRNTNTGG